MFPDPTAEWIARPTIMDGIRKPRIDSAGTLAGTLYLQVRGGIDGEWAFGVEMDAIAYAGIQEKIFWASGHSAVSLRADANTYLREATRSALLDLNRSLDLPDQGKLRHFQLLATNYCYECLCLGAPRIRQFISEGDARNWGPGRLG